MPYYSEFIDIDYVNKGFSESDNCTFINNVEVINY